jgi:hypothetical protein
MPGEISKELYNHKENAKESVGAFFGLIFGFGFLQGVVAAQCWESHIIDGLSDLRKIPKVAHFWDEPHPPLVLALIAIERKEAPTPT